MKVFDVLLSGSLSFFDKELSYCVFTLNKLIFCCELICRPKTETRKAHQPKILKVEEHPNKSSKRAAKRARHKEAQKQWKAIQRNVSSVYKFGKEITEGLFMSSSVFFYCASVFFFSCVCFRRRENPTSQP